MLNTKESINFFADLKRSLSPARFAGYGNRGSDLDAFAKYLWNIHLCESLCPCFQLLEVAFRNRTHSRIAGALKEPNWISNQHRVLYQDEQDAIAKAKQSLQLSVTPLTEDYLISEMKFGFWTGLLNSRYEILWRKIIADVFPNMPNTIRTRAEASALMNGIRRLRNEALHHHSIWHWKDLKDRHAEMRLMIKYICTASASMASQVDRFPNVYANGIGECQKIASKILREVQKPEDSQAIQKSESKTSN
jgi:hypothetical protein